MFAVRGNSQGALEPCCFHEKEETGPTWNRAVQRGPEDLCELEVVQPSSPYKERSAEHTHTRTHVTTQWERRDLPCLLPLPIIYLGVKHRPAKASHFAVALLFTIPHFSLQSDGTAALPSDCKYSCSCTVSLRFCHFHPKTNSCSFFDMLLTAKRCAHPLLPQGWVGRCTSLTYSCKPGSDCCKLNHRNTPKRGGGTCMCSCC